MQILQPIAVLLGRIFISAIFILSGFSKVMDAAGTQAHMSHAGLPMVKVLYPLTVLVELGGGLLILVGWQARWAALAAFLFLIPVTLTFHWNWDDKMQQIQFWKNLAIMGGLLVLAAYGAGAISVDGARRRYVAGRPHRGYARTSA